MNRMDQNPDFWRKDAPSASTETTAAAAAYAASKATFAAEKQAEYEARPASGFAPAGFEVVYPGHDLDGQECPAEAKIEKFSDGRFFAYLPYTEKTGTGVFVAPKQIAAKVRQKVLREMYA